MKGLTSPESRNRIFLRYHKLIDFLIPLGTRRRLLIILLTDALIRRDKQSNVKGFYGILDTLYNLILNRPYIVAERARGIFSASSGNGSINYFRSECYNGPLSQAPFLKIYISSKPRVSIVIPVANNVRHTYNCLHFISKQKTLCEYEVIIVDNGSTDETPLLLQTVEGLIVIRNETNLGFVEACNLGAQPARGQYILFLNNDAYMMPECLNEMIKVMDHDQSVGAVGAKLLYPNGLLQEAGGIVWNDPDRIAWNYGKFDSPWRYEYNYTKEVDYCSGACLLVRRKAFLEVGMFDQEFAPAYFEDTDLAFSLRKHGFKVVYQPKAVAVHHEGATAGKDMRKGLKKYQLINQNKFYKKWKDILTIEHYQAGRDVFLARERSRSKQIVLYIDHEVPSYDKDAGSLITFQYLNILAEMNYKVIFWPANLKDTEPYTTTLQERGIEVVYGYANFTNYIKRYGKYISIVFISRALTAISFLDKIKENSKAKIIYIPHDLHFLRESRRAELENSKKLGKYAQRLRRLELSIATKSDLTLVFSDVEKKILEEQNPRLNVGVLPWIQEIKSVSPTYELRDGLMFIGSFRHLPNVDGVLWFFRDIFPIIRQHLPHVRCTVVGSNPTEEIIALNNDQVTVTGYVRDPREYFVRAKLFIAPLRYGAGIKGKVIEAMSYGLPVVTTSVGAEGLGLLHNKHACIADTADSFALSVVELYKNRDLWLSLFQESRNYVERNASVMSARKTIERATAIDHE